MGRNVFEVDGLGGALDRAVERVMHIPRGRRMVVDNHQQKIVIILEGGVRALVNGVEAGVLDAGDALVIPGACKQTYVPVVARRETRLHALIVVFRRGVFACDGNLLRAVPVAGADAQAVPEDFLREHFGSVQVRRGVLTPAVAASLEALRREAAGKDTGYRLRAAAQVWLLLTEIARRERPPAVVASAEEPLSRREWLVTQVKNFVFERHAEELTLDQVAWHVRMSAEHLARTFRKATGQTVFGYVQQLRLERAKTRLAGTQLTVNEIAREAGFGTASQLCRTFKQATGETPLAYRLRTAGDADFSPSVFEGKVV